MGGEAMIPGIKNKNGHQHTRIFVRDNKQKQLFVLPNQASMRHPLQLRKAETQVPGVCVCVWKNFQFFLLLGIYLSLSLSDL